VADLAQRVINGEFGNGDARRAALGDRYGEVQAEVNRILGGGSSGSSDSGGSSSVDVDDLARRVIAGEFGNGDARKAALGANYPAVQARVNEMLGCGSSGCSSGSGSVDIDALVRAVINGDYGNGEERRQRLGANYAAVQARVNEMLS
jgi:N-acetylmuramoyl-L-alanine amidase